MTYEDQLWAAAHLRNSLSSVLSGNARYVGLDAATKRPYGRYKRKNDAAALHSIPASEDYGVIPENDLIIFDIDRKESSTPVNEQVEYLNKVLGTDLRSTFAVSTPGGGFHFYLSLPPRSRNIVRNVPQGSLRGYQKSFRAVMGDAVKLEVDVRKPGVANYVVGPTSQGYSVARFPGFTGSVDDATITIQRVPMEGLRRLVKVREAFVKDREKRNSKDRTDPHEHYYESTVKSTRERVPAAVVALLELKLKEKRRTYHARRAFLVAALHCCYTPKAIAEVCRELKVDKDAYRGGKLSDIELLADIRGFKPSDRYHGPYCRQVPSKKGMMGGAVVSNGKSLEDNLEALRGRRKKGGLARTDRKSRQVDRRVLDPVAVSEALLGNSKKVTQQYLDAMSVFDFFIQPLTNVGARNVMLAYSALEEHLDLTPSRARQALRILRDRGIIHLSQKQRTGLSALYRVSENFVHPQLTKDLNTCVGAVFSDEVVNSRPVYFNRITGMFHDVFEGFTADFVPDYQAVYDVLNAEVVGVPGFVCAGSTVRYLKEEAQELGYEVDEDGCFIVAAYSPSADVENWDNEDESAENVSESQQKEVEGAAEEDHELLGSESWDDDEMSSSVSTATFYEQHSDGIVSYLISSGSGNTGSGKVLLKNYLSNDEGSSRSVHLLAELTSKDSGERMSVRSKNETTWGSLSKSFGLDSRTEKIVPQVYTPVPMSEVGGFQSSYDFWDQRKDLSVRSKSLWEVVSTDESAALIPLVVNNPVFSPSGIAVARKFTTAA